MFFSKRAFPNSLYALALSLTLYSTQSFALCVPTWWKVENKTADELTVQCAGQLQGLPNEFDMTVRNLAPGSSKNHSWDYMYNDGMGLNAGNWTCAAGRSENPLDDNQTLKSTFSTKWGECITVRVEGFNGRYILKRN